MSIMLITTREETLRDFITGLEQSGREVRVVPGIESETVQQFKPELAVVDSAAGLDPLAAVMELMRIDCNVNTAAFSAMDAKEFSDRCEGLGLLIERPLEPTGEDAGLLLAALERVQAL